MGILCFLLGLLSVFGGMFSSIGFAASAVLFVVVPIAIALIGANARSKVFPTLMLLGCGVTISYILSIYLHDYFAGMSPTAFVHERIGWVYLALNSAQIVLSVIKLRQSTFGDGATPWPH
jgi:hypothetical protein